MPTLMHFDVRVHVLCLYTDTKEQGVADIEHQGRRTIHQSPVVFIKRVYCNFDCLDGPFDNELKTKK